MNVAGALQGVARLFLDTAPVIYYVESNPYYLDQIKIVFDRIDAGLLIAVTSPVTLAECLVAPYRSGSTQLQQDFFDLIVYGHNTIFAPIEKACARQAAELRARHNITLTDAFQIASALGTACNAFLTNDANLKRVTELQILVLSELS